jgi:hypothetical protein
VDHKLQLAVNDTFRDADESVMSIITRVRDISVYIRSSSNRRALLHEMQKNNDRRILVPKLDCETRWCSLFEMLKRYQEIHDDIMILILRDVFSDYTGMSE